MKTPWSTSTVGGRGRTGRRFAALLRALGLTFRLRDHARAAAASEAWVR